jgi:hypothetical protein
MKRKKNEFNFTFNGQLDSIEVNSLTGSLLALNELIKDVSYEMGTNKKVELTIKTYKPGSFDVYLQLVADAISVGATVGMFTGNNIEIANKVIETALHVLKLKKFLGGKKPTQVIETTENKIEITNNYGKIFIIDKLVYEMSANNEKIDKHVSDIFKPIENKETVTGISIRDYKDKVSFESYKEDGSFDMMLSPNPAIATEEENLRDKPINNAFLSVYSLTFGETKKWEFYYEGNKIPVKVLDHEFLDKAINREYIFGNGDKIKCNLIIHQKWNKIAMVYENKSYSLLKVIGDPIPPNPQGKLEF